jgi:hypothetical protein
MGVDNAGLDYTLVAGADLTACQYTAVTYAGALSVVGATFAGIIQNKAQTGEHLTVRMLGMSKFRAGPAVAVGDLIKPTTSGYLITCASGFNAVGECIFAAASGGLGTAILRGKYYTTSL